MTGKVELHSFSNGNLVMRPNMLESFFRRI